MLELLATHVRGRPFRVGVTERIDGDFHPRRTPPEILAERERLLTGTTWSMADQVHGVDCWVVPTATPAPVLGPAADVLIVRGDAEGPAVAMWSADCATALLLTPDGDVIGVHAGWRGLAAGVFDVAIEASRSEGGIRAVLGPMVGPCCYEFGSDELRSVAEGVGTTADSITGTTTEGAVALDVPRAVAAVLARHGVSIEARAPGCTGCSGRWWSHRVSSARERQAIVGWWS